MRWSVLKDEWRTCCHGASGYCDLPTASQKGDHLLPGHEDLNWGKAKPWISGDYCISRGPMIALCEVFGYLLGSFSLRLRTTARTGSGTGSSPSDLIPTSVLWPPGRVFLLVNGTTSLPSRCRHKRISPLLFRTCTLGNSSSLLKTYRKHNILGKACPSSLRQAEFHLPICS